MNEVIAEAREKMLAVISSVADVRDKEKMLAVHEQNPGFVFLSMGIHPEHIFYYKQKDIDDYIEFIKNNRKCIVAIGEVGVDYNWVKDTEKHLVMKNVFNQFIGLSKELKLPLVIHCRSGDNMNAFDDVLKILTDANVEKVALHCFSGSETNLKYALEQGYMISYATIICKSDKHKRLAGKTPLENMLLETDSPWLDPFVKELVNRPWKIIESAKVIAGIKNVPVESIIEKTTENAKEFFKLKI
jgi:TatD DNase family protein